MKNIKIKHSIYFIIICFMCFGCKSKQISHHTTIPQKTAEEMVMTIIQNQPQFSSMNISKMDINLTWKNHNFSCKGSLKIQKDSLLSLSIQPFLGIEAYRAKFYPDKFILIDKMNRKYTENNYDFLKYKFGITMDFFTLQAICSNQLFCLDNTTIRPQLFSVQQNNHDTLIMGYNLQDISQQFKITGNHQITEADISYGNARFTTKYTEHAKQANWCFPQHAEAYLTWQEDVLSIDLKINKITFNQPLDFPEFSPNRYQKVTFSDLLP